MDIEKFRAFVAGYPSLKTQKFSARPEISGDVKLAGGIEGTGEAAAEYQLVKRQRTGRFIRSGSHTPVL
jgi:hypothetical protein